MDAGIEKADRVFGEALFRDDFKLHHVWTNLPCHGLQEDEPMGDRHWVSKSKPLQVIFFLIYERPNNLEVTVFFELYISKIAYQLNNPKLFVSQICIINKLAN